MRGMSVPIDTTTNGNTTVVPAVANLKCKVLSYHIVAGGAVNIKFTDGAGGTVIEGKMPFAANGGIVVNEPSQKEGECLFQTSVNTALVMNTDAGVQVGGSLRYMLSND